MWRRKAGHDDCLRLFLRRDEDKAREGGETPTSIAAALL
jgi:hypothetical protein